MSELSFVRIIFDGGIDGAPIAEFQRSDSDLPHEPYLRFNLETLQLRIELLERDRRDASVERAVLPSLESQTRKWERSRPL